MIYPAIVYNDKERGVFVSMDPDDFTGLLEEYYDKYKDMKKAMEAIEVDLKKKTMYK